MRKKRFFLNSLTSLGYQMATIVCGLILPNLIIRTYGTTVNGLVSSINQFLRLISLGEFGMTAVIQSSLYVPLVEKDMHRISEIMTASDRFFKRIAGLLLIYVGLLCVFFPMYVKSGFDRSYVASLIVILSFSSFAQYLFAFTNSQLLNADQRAYVIFASDILAITGNTVISAVAIRHGAGIHLVKILSSIVFLARPVFTSIYVKKYYEVNRRAVYTKEPISQKWNGVAQHLAFYVFTSTDVMVLTMFSTLSNVSIYSVYALILNGLRALSSLFEQAVRSVLGEFWALKEKEKFSLFFALYERTMIIISSVLYGCAASLIVPFIQVYTKNVYDTDYSVPTFALLISIAYLIQNLRTPYHTLIQAVGHYKETQMSYLTAAIVNIVLSIAMVYRLGLIGVAIGTLIAALIETLWQSEYLYRTILMRSYIEWFRMFAVFGIQFTISLFICSRFQLRALSYLAWLEMAVPTVIVWFGCAALFSMLFYWRDFVDLMNTINK